MKLIGFAFGIRTVKSFSIEDKLGAIIDEILYSQNSQFNENLFPEVRENHNTKLLFDPQRNNKFTITPQDFIFEYNIQNDFDIEFDKFLKGYVNTITQKVFKEFKIKNISRFGFVVKAELSAKDKFLNEITAVIEANKGNKGIDDGLSLRFNVITKKPIQLPKLVTEDYDNEIISYDKPNSTSPLLFTVDFQKYFTPELNIIEDATINFENFCRNTMEVYRKSYFVK